MALYVGETVAIRIGATNPFTGDPLTPDDGYSCKVDVYQPGVNPKTTPAVRDDAASQLASGLDTVYDTDQQAYFAFVSSAGWDLTATSQLWYRGTLIGPEYNNVEFARFRISP